MSQSPPSSDTPSSGSHSATHHLSATIINPIPGQVRKPRVGKVGELLGGGCQTRFSLACVLHHDSTCFTQRCRGPGREMATLRTGEAPHTSQPFQTPTCSRPCTCHRAIPPP